MTSKKKALGRGLDAILQGPETDYRSREIADNYVVGAIAEIPLEYIDTNPFQPRDNFEEDALMELAESIKEQGIVQPITVRKVGLNKFQLISGERRFRASRIAGLQKIPSYIRVANDEQMLEMALIENIHRENLNSVEIAISFQRLIEECSLTHEKLSSRVGKKRATITNYLRLLKLPADIQVALRENKISMGHARALINIEHAQKQINLLNRIIHKDLSVRQVEEIVRKLNQPEKEAVGKNSFIIPEKYAGIQDDLSGKYDTKIQFRLNNKGKGSIVIPFENTEELEDILKKI